jgi:hypothetical protein
MISQQGKLNGLFASSVTASELASRNACRPLRLPMGRAWCSLAIVGTLLASCEPLITACDAA